MIVYGSRRADRRDAAVCRNTVTVNAINLLSVNHSKLLDTYVLLGEVIQCSASTIVTLHAPVQSDL